MTRNPMTQPTHNRGTSVTSANRVPTDVVMEAVPTAFGFRLVRWLDMTEPEKAAYRTFVHDHNLPHKVRKVSR